MNKETICALATANGMGAIGVIRVSGDDSFRIVNTVFEGKTKRQLPIPYIMAL